MRSTKISQNIDEVLFEMQNVVVMLILVCLVQMIGIEVDDYAILIVFLLYKGGLRDSAVAGGSFH